MGSKKRRRSGKLIPEPLLLTRVNKYLESKPEERINLNEMIEDLRTWYMDYGKRDKAAFSASIIRAYNYIISPPKTDDFNMSDVSSSDEVIEESASEEADEVVVEDDESSSQVKESRSNGAVSYMNVVQKMVNSGGFVGELEVRPNLSNQKVSQNQTTIDISSDEGESGIAEVITSDRQPTTTFDKRMTNKLKNSVLLIDKVDSAKSRMPVEISVAKVLSSGSNQKRSSKSGNSKLSDVIRSYSDSRIAGTSRKTEGVKRKSTSSVPSMPSKRKVVLESAYIPTVNFSSFAGNDALVKRLVTVLPFLTSGTCMYKKLGVTPPRGFLLHGPPGCGKTLLATCIAGEMNVPLIRVAGPELISGVSGESEARIRDLFDEACSIAPCVLFIDEIDAISGPRDSATKDMERRVVSQLLCSIDELNEEEEWEEVLLVGATSRPESLDAGLRRAGRFDRELALGMPDRNARRDIFKLITKTLKLSDSVSLDLLAELTPGYVGADIKALVNEAALSAIARITKQGFVENKNTNTNQNSSEDGKCAERPPDDEESASKKTESSTNTVDAVDNLDDLSIEPNDFETALKEIQPSAKREGFATVPGVTWEDIGSLHNVRDQLQSSILMPARYPDEFAKLGMTNGGGVLLCGPPGCGKTLLAKAVANEANINFISVKGPELLNMYLGESERAVRQCFQRARNSQPCVIFFDEIDALCPKRSISSDSVAGSRVVNQLLTEMDGVEGGRGGVFIMAATNRPDTVDPAILRPGRLDKTLYVGLPTAEDRADILRAITKNGKCPPLTEDVDLIEIGKQETLSGFSGADLAALVREASLIALKEYVSARETSDGKNEGVDGSNLALAVSSKHFTAAVPNIRPSISEKDKKRYENYKHIFTSVPDETVERMEEDAA